MLPVVSCTLLESAIDYVTCTYSGSERSLEVMRGRASSWLNEREREGFRRKPWNGLGYSGSIADGITVGYRDGSMLIRLSGKMASKRGPVALTWATNVARLDIQATFQDIDLDRDWARLIRSHMSQRPGVDVGVPQVKLVTMEPRGSTVYVGSRVSHRMMRVYDKYEESEHAYPPGSWRVEMEYKQDVARRVTSHLAGRSYSPSCIVETLLGEADHHAMVLPIPFPDLRWRPIVVNVPTDDERRIEWLRSSIRPMVERMLETTDLDTLTNALGLPLYPNYSAGGPLETDIDGRHVPDIIG